jgi:hypothetical protein
MRSDFINKRNIKNRVRLDGGSQQQTTDSEIIVIPEFDTFYWHNPTGPADDRWNGTPVLPNGGNFEQATQVPIGLLNPWNDGEDAPLEGGRLGTLIQVRSPTRTAMAFNLTSLPANAEIREAKLNLTVANKRNWD